MVHSNSANFLLRMSSPWTTTQDTDPRKYFGTEVSRGLFSHCSRNKILGLNPLPGHDLSVWSSRILCGYYGFLPCRSKDLHIKHYGDLKLVVGVSVNHSIRHLTNRCVQCIPHPSPYDSSDVPAQTGWRHMNGWIFIGNMNSPKKVKKKKNHNDVRVLFKQ